MYRNAVLHLVPRLLKKALGDVFSVLSSVGSNTSCFPQVFYYWICFFDRRKQVNKSSCISIWRCCLKVMQVQDTASKMVRECPLQKLPKTNNFLQGFCIWRQCELIKLIKVTEGMRVVPRGWALVGVRLVAEDPSLLKKR